ncbi:hypothetical protein N431DRAFT_524055 [Stipitochalara longipes BDJ]|nr:hypothetical protein N431DRAFT_524055 [Stipitochalara longipes BDJ]
MRMLHKSEPEFSEACKEIIHRLLALEPDLHNYYVSAGGTLLGEILDIAESPFESGKVGEQWLGILEDFGHDIKEYLQVELLEQEEWNSIAILISQWTAEPDVAADGTPRRYIIFSEENPRVSWDWYIDSEGHAFEALYEFRNLGRFTHVPIQDYNRPGESFNWPYFYPQWQNLPFAITRRHNTEAMKSSLRIRIAILKNRHEHRWIKRANKLERAQGIKRGPKVPGAWID